MRFSKLIALGMLAVGSCALYADDLYLGGPYSSVPFSTGTEGGGSISNSTLNGVALPWVYCVQLTVDVGVPGDYNQTIVNNTGVIANSSAPPPDAAQAGDIAWLLTNYAVGGQGDQAVALQAAIWDVEGFGSLYTGPVTTSNSTTADATQILDYNNMLSALSTANGSGGAGTAGTADIGNFDWMTPGIGTNHQYQGLVTVPDGGMTLMMLGGVLAGLETLRRRFSA